MHIDTYTYIYWHIRSIQTYMYICTNTYIHTDTCIYIQYVQILTIHTYMIIYIQSKYLMCWIRTYTCIYIHIRTYTPLVVYARILSNLYIFICKYVQILAIWTSKNEYVLYGSLKKVYELGMYSQVFDSIFVCILLVYARIARICT